MADQIFKAIDAALPVQGSALVDKFKGDVQFVIDGQKYHLALSGKAEFTPGEKKADLVVTVNEENFLALCSGKISPTAAFMSGKVQIKGKMPLAMKLDQVLNLARPRAKL